MNKEKTLLKLKQEIEEVREKFGVEFAEVVRCKDCFWSRKQKESEYHIICELNDYAEFPISGYCSYGERREAR